jgi:hypothetical protein
MNAAIHNMSPKSNNPGGCGGTSRGALAEVSVIPNWTYVAHNQEVQ